MPELFGEISLKKDSDSPLYLQLYSKIKEMIENGILSPDYRLPSIRKLSSMLKINQVTVVSAYRQLESEGYVYSRPGSGIYVSRFPGNPLTRSQAGSLMADELYNQDDLAIISGGNIKIHEGTINFASATPTPDTFPVEDFKAAINEVLDRDKGSAFGYHESQGYIPLRECLCDMLKENGIPCKPENMMIISGAQQGIDIISKAFLHQGDYIITESPTYTGAIAVFNSRRAEIVDVEMKEDGPDLNILEYSLKKYRPRLIYTIPTFQNPTGYSYSIGKRSALLDLADRYDVYIIEDDYVSDLDFEDRKYVPLKAMDKNSRVIFIKSFSKIFMPGLRLGFMLVPERFHGNLLEAKHTTDISTSGLIQRAFDLYIRKGFWNRHWNFMYNVYKERYFTMINALDRHLPGSVGYRKPGGGLNIWLNVDYRSWTESLFNRSAAAGVLFAPGRIFYSGSHPQNLYNIRLSFAAVYREQIEEGIAKLCEIMDSLQKDNHSPSNLPIL